MHSPVGFTPILAETTSGAVAMAPAPSRARPTLLSRLVEWVGLVLLALLVLALLSLTVGPLVLPYKALTVLSGSMEPTIHVGAVVIDTPVSASDVKVGDIITFQRPDRQNELVTHRVIQIETGPNGQKQWITKGDANNVADAWRIPATGSGYKYDFSVPYIGWALAWMQTPLGRLLFLIVPAAALGLLTLYELWWPRRAAPGS